MVPDHSSKEMSAGYSPCTIPKVCRQKTTTRRSYSSGSFFHASPCDASATLPKSLGAFAAS